MTRTMNYAVRGPLAGLMLLIGTAAARQNPFPPFAQGQRPRPSPPTGQAPRFEGIWVQTDATDAPPIRIKIAQDGIHLTIWLSGKDYFSDSPQAYAEIQGRKAVWTGPQGCAEEFQTPGYDYSNPGTNIFTLELYDSTLLYSVETTWTSPCGNPVGTQKAVMHLTRIQ